MAFSSKKPSKGAAAGGVSAVAKPAAAKPAHKPWRQLLISNSEGNPVPCLANIALIFSHDKEWQHLLQFNAFVGDISCTREPPWPEDIKPESCKAGDWSENDCGRAEIWLTRKHQIIAKPSVVNAALKIAADRKTTHPVRDWLGELVWDKKKRVDDFFIRLAGADDTAYTKAVTKNFFIGAVARIFKPGSKVDTMPILEGEQGIGKTTLLEILGGDWYMTTTEEPGTKDSYQVLRGKWIVEFGELDSLSRSEMSSTKQYISQTSDRYRPSFGASVIDFPRQVVFVGTINPDAGGYLKDPTGARRFQPIELRARPGRATIDLQGIKAEREQLWAEAVVRYKSGEKWHIEGSSLLKEAASVAEDRRQTDLWEEFIAVWLGGLPRERRVEGITIAEAAVEGLKMDVATQLDRSASMRLATVLKACGWSDKSRVRRNGSLVWAYRKKYPTGLKTVTPETATVPTSKPVFQPLRSIRKGVQRLDREE